MYTELLGLAGHTTLLVMSISDCMGLGGPWSVFSPFWGLAISQQWFLKRNNCLQSRRSLQEALDGWKRGSFQENQCRHARFVTQRGRRWRSLVERSLSIRCFREATAEGLLGHWRTGTEEQGVGQEGDSEDQLHVPGPLRQPTAVSEWEDPK